MKYNRRCKWNYIIFLFVITLVILISNISLASGLRVAPQRFIFNAEKQVTRKVNVMNVSENPIRVRIYSEQPPGQNKEEYLGEWMTIYPPVLTISPGEKRVVRFSVDTPEDLDDGEYRALLFFEEQPTDNSITDQTEKNEGEDVKIDFQLLVRLGISVYGRIGKLNFKGEMNNTSAFLNENTLTVEGDFINNGNVHLRMTARTVVEDEKGNIVLKKNTPFIVQRGTEREFKENFKDVKIDKGKVKVFFEDEKNVIEKIDILF